MGSVKFGTSPLPTEININYSKADGEKEWVGNQTSIIAKEGGTIESKDFTNSGAIIGSESKENKLIVKADNVNIDNLKDKDTNKVSGGGVNITNKGVPNISVITGGQDKRQDTNATAVNTEFIVQGENKSAEELGFNIDLNKAQVITKDENKVLDADLHTDLLNKDERDKIVEAGEKLGNLAEAIINPNDGGIGNTYKENRFGNLFNKYVSEQKEKLNILGDPNISEIDKRNVLNDIVKDFLLSKGYKGEMPQILIGDKTESTDIRYTGKEYVFISKEDLNSSNILSILGHELGHMNTYDIDEETAEKIESKVDTKVDQSDTNGKYNTYLKELQEKYKELPDEEEAKEFQKNIPDEYKESFAISDNSISFAGAFLGRVNAGGTTYYIVDTKTGKGEEVKTADIGIGLGTPTAGGSMSMVILPYANNSKDIEGYSKTYGGSISIFSGEILFDSKGNFSGIKYSNSGISPEINPKFEFHGSYDSSIIRQVKEISTNEKIIKITKELESLSSTPENALKNIIKINSLSSELLNEIRKINNKGGETLDNIQINYQVNKNDMYQ